jgi:hypothetical protein
MTDSIAVFPPGYRVLNSHGQLVAGAKLKFFDAGTTTPKTVYSDATLATSLGAEVTCDSGGYPTSDGSTKVQVFTGTAAYKLRITTSADVTLAEHDSCVGALDTSGFGAGDAATFETPVVSKSLDYTVLVGDQSTLFNVNSSGGDVVMTLPSAVTMGTGWRAGFRHAGTANQVMLATVSSQTISMGTTTGTRFPLESIGETVWLVSDGANWNVDTYVPRFKGAVGIITIADRLNTPPGGPVQGAKYIVTSGMAGDWSTYAEHDIAEYTGNGWVKVTPAADCGWIGYVADEDIYYRFTASAWVAESATTSVAGTVRLADSTAMEAMTASRGVTADVQHRHPGHAKAWLTFDGTGTPAIAEDYGVSSLTDNGTGDWTVNFDTAFSATANYGVMGSWARYWTVGSNSGIVSADSTDTKTTSAFRLGVRGNGGSNFDSPEVAASFAGDQ